MLIFSSKFVAKNINCYRNFAIFMTKSFPSPESFFFLPLYSLICIEGEVIPPVFHLLLCRLASYFTLSFLYLYVMSTNDFMSNICRIAFLPLVTEQAENGISPLWRGYMVSLTLVDTVLLVFFISSLKRSASLSETLPEAFPEDFCQTGFQKKGPGFRKRYKLEMIFLGSGSTGGFVQGRVLELVGSSCPPHPAPHIWSRSWASLLIDFWIRKHDL